MPLSRAALYIPVGTRYNYAPNEPWKNFSQIIEIDVSGLDAITTDIMQGTRSFTMDGRSVGDNDGAAGTITIKRLPDGSSIKQIVR